jgi:Pyridoxamine 5'-phosphate oxidase
MSGNGGRHGGDRPKGTPGAGAPGEPARERPRFPPGYGVPETLEGLLEWRWAEERLERAKTYWICTTRPDGAPHARPIWGAWAAQSFFFDGGGRWSHYLRENPRMTVHLEGGDEVVIVEGRVAPVTALPPEVFAAVREGYRAKYEYAPEAPRGLYRVRPRFVFCWSRIDKDPTRFRFDRPRRRERPGPAQP